MLNGSSAEVLLSLQLTLVDSESFCFGCCKKKKKKDGRQRSHFYNNSILSAGNLDLWCMREFPRLANLDKQISLEIQDSFRTGPT